MNVSGHVLEIWELLLLVLLESDRLDTDNAAGDEHLDSGELLVSGDGA